MEIWNDGDFDAARDVVRRRHDRQKVLRDGDRASERCQLSLFRPLTDGSRVDGTPQWVDVRRGRGETSAAL